MKSFNVNLSIFKGEQNENLLLQREPDVFTACLGHNLVF